jgi:deoxycytidine triphosphate deaminase
MLLRDQEIYELLEAPQPLITNVTVGPRDYTKNSWVQSASLDLHVGNIYVPEMDPEKLGGSVKPKQDHILEPGHTAVVETKEILDLPAYVGAIGFPPSRVSAEGILMTNPGHVDPGYKGRLSLTIINMGRAEYNLHNGNVILTLLFLRISAPCHANYGDRSGDRPRESVVSEDRLSRLSKDFLQVGDRAEKVAKNEESKTRRWALVAPALIAAIAVAGTVLGAYLQSHSALAKQVQDQGTEISVLRQQIADISAGKKIAKVNLSTLESRESRY